MRRRRGKTRRRSRRRGKTRRRRRRDKTRRRRRGKPCREGESDKEDDLVQGDQCDTPMILLGGNAVHDGDQWSESPQ